VKFRIALLAALTMCLGDVAIAQNGPPAATPILSGKYIVRVTHVCQPTIAVIQSQSNQGPPTVTDVTVGPPGFSGDANQNIGIVDFDHASGQATLSAHSIDGSPFVLTMNGGPPLGNLVTDTPPPSPLPTFPFSNDGTSFMITTNSGPVTYYAYYANISQGSKIPQFMIFGGIEKAGCTTTGIAIHQ
jgi:hypothetical protein